MTDPFTRYVAAVACLWIVGVAIVGAVIVIRNHFYEMRGLPLDFAAAADPASPLDAAAPLSTNSERAS